MEKSAFYHRTESEYAYLYTEDEIHIRLRTKKNDVAQVILHYGDTALFDFTQDYQYHISMSIITNDLCHDYWQASVKVDYRRISYLFEIIWELLKISHISTKLGKIVLKYHIYMILIG